MLALLDRSRRHGVRILALAALAVGLVVALAGPASAATTSGTVQVPLQAQWWVYLVSVFIPLVVALFSKAHLPAIWKSTFAIVLAAVTTFIQQIIDNHGLFTLAALRTAVLALVIQLLSYHQLWKPVFEHTGAPAPEFGIGQPVPPPHPEP